MKIAICGSMSFAQEMLTLRDSLVAAGHVVVVPHDAELYAKQPGKLEEKWQKKLEQDLIRNYYNEIGTCDAVLVLNITKSGIGNYVGGNAFLEMGFAHVLGKRIYLYHPVPELPYRDEMMAMRPIVINGDLSLIHDKA